MDNHKFNPVTELQQIREILAAGKRKPYPRRKLDKHRAELVLLHKHGASLAEMQTWLRSSKKTNVHRSTISRYLKTLPELKNHG